VDAHNKKDRRHKKMSGASKRMDQAVENGPGGATKTAGDGPENGLSLTLQAHIGRHVRAVFDEVAREPIPEHLLRLLRDLEQSGDK
jgi:Anti-sigma factor NepR